LQDSASKKEVIQSEGFKNENNTGFVELNLAADSEDSSGNVKPVESPKLETNQGSKVNLLDREN